jgi:hypothetical protein
MLDKIRYYSLDEAREEIKKRWNNIELRKKIEEDLGENRLFYNNVDSPSAVLLRHISSPDNGFNFFYYSAKYLNITAVAPEYLGDKFVSINEEKKALSCLKVILKNGDIGCFDIMNIADNDGKKISECSIHNGRKLIEFHEGLKKISNLSVLNFDATYLFYKKFNNASDYYYYLLLNFILHGVLFETFDESEVCRENDFVASVVIPAFVKIKNKYNLDPIVVSLYPKDQTDKEDLFWWCYPPNINDYLVEYAEENNIKINVLLKNIKQ